MKKIKSLLSTSRFFVITKINCRIRFFETPYRLKKLFTRVAASAALKSSIQVVLFSILSSISSSSSSSKVHRFRQTSVSLVKSFVHILTRSLIALCSFGFSRVGRCFFLRRGEKYAISQSLHLRIFIRRTVNFSCISLRSRRLRRLSLNVVWRKRQSSTITRRFR